MELDLIQSAIQKGDAANVRELIAQEPDLLQARTAQGVSMISLACYLGQPAIAAIFAECGGMVDLFDASAMGDLDRVRALIENFPESVNAWSPDGFYPLGLAAFFGHGAIVKLLLKSGADVNQVAKNALLVRPIHAAVSRGDAEIVKMLLDHGADVNARQQNEFTALHGAAGAGRMDLIEILVAHGADLKATSADGKTAADIASARGHADTAASLRALI
jgi:uncharacterized protein